MYSTERRPPHADPIVAPKQRLPRFTAPFVAIAVHLPEGLLCFLRSQRLSQKTWQALAHLPCRDDDLPIFPYSRSIFSCLKSFGQRRVIFKPLLILACALFLLEMGKDEAMIIRRHAMADIVLHKLLGIFIAYAHQAALAMQGATSINHGESFLVMFKPDSSDTVIEVGPTSALVQWSHWTKIDDPRMHTEHFEVDEVLMGMINCSEFTATWLSLAPPAYGANTSWHLLTDRKFCFQLS